jgi:hypothetical protein
MSNNRNAQAQNVNIANKSTPTPAQVAAAEAISAPVAATPDMAALMARIAAMEAEVTASKAAQAKAEQEAANAKAEAEARNSRQVFMKVSEKGGLSVYGLGRFPVTLYKEQWRKLFALIEDIKKFILADEAGAKQLKAKEDNAKK